MYSLLILTCGFLYVTGSPNLRTAILIEKRTEFGQNLFFRGGLDYSRKEGCDSATSLESNPCVIPILHNISSIDAYKAAKAWSKGDNYLDWSGAEPEQGDWTDIPASGSPAIWTTNDPSKETFNILNTYGDHYWLLDVEMDCGKTLNGFFEVKGFLDGQWENDIKQAKKCSGTEAVRRPFESKNHIAKCGAKNVFHYNDGSCEISKFD
ncbi:alpha-amylase [Biomphalaria pfeifferi]|uniref:Alpha-amylase n=1 Tax=Biomphalaria pfeifferi TaxID=112525 RepID=A0AAD8B1K2_BIOPF|nr:alpha-amylase [Biomphalaria pfeifferi]